MWIELFTLLGYQGYEEEIPLYITNNMISDDMGIGPGQNFVADAATMAGHFENKDFFAKLKWLQLSR